MTAINAKARCFHSCSFGDLILLKTSLGLYLLDLVKYRLVSLVPIVSHLESISTELFASTFRLLMRFLCPELACDQKGRSISAEQIPLGEHYSRVRS